MSGLARILAGQHPSGVYLWHADVDTDDVRRSVQQAGWHFGHLDGWAARGKADLLTAVGEVLEFPAHYGRNFDALADCLYDIDVDTVLLWDGWATLARAEESAFSVMIDIFTERADAAGRFVVLLRGDGPDLPAGIASLD